VELKAAHEGAVDSTANAMRKVEALQVDVTAAAEEAKKSAKASAKSAEEALQSAKAADEAKKVAEAAVAKLPKDD